MVDYFRGVLRSPSRARTREPDGDGTGTAKWVGPEILEGASDAREGVCGLTWGLMWGRVRVSLWEALREPSRGLKCVFPGRRATTSTGRDPGLTYSSGGQGVHETLEFAGQR